MTLLIQAHRKMLALAAGLLLQVLCAIPVHAAGADFVATVMTTRPLAFYHLNAVEGQSMVGPTRYRASGGISLARTGAPVGAGSPFIRLHGTDGYIVSTQAGGIHGAGSMMAWIKLNILPSAANHILYVMGESQSGNDFDLQFEADNQLKFYTAAGDHLSYAPPPDTLLDQWHLVVTTLDTRKHARAIYWDGQLVASDGGSGGPDKHGIFSIGDSTVFRGRYFNGGMQEVALWNRALDQQEVAAIYAAAGPVTGEAAPQGMISASAGYLGCYKDTDLRDLNGKHWSDPQMTQDRCIDSCRADNFAYAAAQYGSHCFCGNSYGRYGQIAETSCNMSCSGDSGHNCGGTWASSVFRLR